MRERINDLFKKEALAISGLVSVYDVPDPFVWRLFRSLDELRLKAVRQAGEDETPPVRSVTRLEPHPAVEEFLRKLRRT